MSLKKLKDIIVNNNIRWIINLKFKILGNNKIIIKGKCKWKATFMGHRNTIIVGDKTTIAKGRILLKGDDNYLEIADNCKIGKNCVFYIIGNKLKIQIGSGVTFTRNIVVNAQEENVSIIIGEDCMFSNNIIIRTSDSHPIYDVNTGQRLNPARSIIIGKHVWIAPNTKIMKGANIGNGSIIGSDTSVFKSIPTNCLYVGRPGKIVKNNIYCTREAL